jgi:hypothetical protein
VWHQLIIHNHCHSIVQPIKRKSAKELAFGHSGRNLTICFFAAFSWFSFCEYLIASANMAFHMTVILDFPTEHLIVAQKSPGMVLIGSTAAQQEPQELHQKPE